MFTVLATLLGGLLGALIAAWAVLRSTRLEREHDLRVRRAEWQHDDEARREARLYERRADAYLGLFTVTAAVWAESVTVEQALNGTESDARLPAAHTTSEPTAFNIEASVQAFASDEIRGRYVGFCELLWGDYANLCASARDGDTSLGDSEQAADILSELRRRLRYLVDGVREELASAAPSTEMDHAAVDDASPIGRR